MTTDERIEAITSNLDTLTKLHLDNDREYREILGSLAATVGRLDIAVEKLTAFAADVKDALRRLTNIAGAHERRLDDLES
jgi:hypothetical protein